MIGMGYNGSGRVRGISKHPAQQGVYAVINQSGVLTLFDSSFHVRYISILGLTCCFFVLRTQRSKYNPLRCFQYPIATEQNSRPFATMMFPDSAYSPVFIPTR
jgi:hypothetical protein